MKYIIYKITNKINGKIYIGAHKTNNINDNYMGSGKLLKKAFQKYGEDCFSKEILYVFNSLNEMFDMEAQLVSSEFILDDNNYNLKEGGFGGWDYVNINNLQYKFNDDDYKQVRNKNKNMVLVKNNNGYKKITTDEYKTGNYNHSTCDKVVVKINGINKQITKNEFDKGDYQGVVSGTVAVTIKATGKKLRITTDDYYANKALYVASAASGEKNAQTKHIKIFDNNNNLVGETKGSFIKYCNSMGLPYYLLQKSYQTNKKINSLNARKQENKDLHGWYAIIIN